MLVGSVSRYPAKNRVSAHLCCLISRSRQICGKTQDFTTGHKNLNLVFRQRTVVNVKFVECPVESPLTKSGTITVISDLDHGIDIRTYGEWFRAFFIDAVEIKYGIASVKRNGQVHPFVFRHNGEGNRPSRFIRNTHSVSIIGVRTGCPQLELEHHSICAPSVRLGEKMLNRSSSRSIPERPKGNSELPHSICRVEYSTVNSYASVWVECKCAAEAFRSEHPFRGSEQRPMVAIAGTVLGGAPGALFKPPPGDEACLSYARQNHAEHQNKRCQINQSSTHNNPPSKKLI
ncbi:hypothetical protein ES703_109683 [subsurface metagenome]